jgi:hypothetical protein
MNELLKSPDRTVAQAQERSPRHSVSLLLGAVACYVGYGAAAGVFRGGQSAMFLALFKMPLVIAGSIALCIPSFYVFSALAGADYSPRELATVLAGFCGTTGLILIGLLPIVWLFSVSSRSLVFVVWLHIFTWAVALVFGREYLLRAANRGSVRGVVGFWLVLVFIVSLQMTTTLRPVLWHVPGAPLFEREKMSFLTHLGRVNDWKEPSAAPVKVMK